MPRLATHKVEADRLQPLGKWLNAYIVSLAAHKNIFRVAMMLTDPDADCRRIEVELPGPITPSGRIGLLLGATGIEVVPDHRISIDAAVGRRIRVQLMVIDDRIEPVAFAAVEDHREPKEP